MTDTDRRMFELYDAALELPESERDAWLDRACTGDSELLGAVRQLIDAANLADDHGFLAGSATCTFEPDLPADPPAAKTIGHYRIIHKIGEGGMGNVYLGEREREFKMRVAIKTLRIGSTDAHTKRFHQERQILASLKHPNIARLLDGGDCDDGTPYLVMEYIEGLDLINYCQTKSLSLKQRLQLVLKMCDAVQYAHQKLILHRDLKPSNIMIDNQGEPKLLDFGVASLLQADTGREFTQTTLGLSPAYASPEQIEQQRLTAQSDIYALGTILYELLTGSLPFEGETAVQVMRQIVEKTAERPSARARHAARALRGDLDRILMCCLDKDPERRYRSAEALRSDIERYLNGHPITATKPTLAYRAGKFLRRHRLMVAVGATLVVITGAYLISMIRAYDQIQHERDVARLERDSAEETTAFLADLFRDADPSEASGQATSVQDILRRGSKRVQDDQGLDPKIASRLLSVLGLVHKNTGQLDEARVLLEQASQIQATGIGETHPDYAVTIKRLAATYRDLGETDRARSLFLKALAIFRAAGPKAAQERADTCNGLGLLEQQLGNYAAADLHFKDAEQQLRTIHDPSALAATLNNRGLLLQRMGRPQPAVDLLQEALTINTEVLGPDHLNIAATLNNLGLLYKDLGQLEATQRAWTRALIIRRRQLSDTHPLILNSLNNLASLHFQTGRWDQAEQQFREIIEIKKQVRGPDHPSVAISMNNLAVVLMQQSHHQEASRLLDQAAAIVDAKLAPDHLLRPSLYRNRALLLVQTGRPEEALDWARRAVEILEQVQEETSPLLAHARGVLGLCLMRSGDLGGARDMLDLSLSRLRTTGGYYGDSVMSWREQLERPQP